MSYRLTIKACDKDERKKEGKTCESMKAIEEYVQSVNVEHWVLEQTIDFNLYKPHKPVQNHQRLVTSDILDPNITKRQFNYLSRNEINCYDNLLNFYEETCNSTFYRISSVVKRDAVKGGFPNTFYHSVISTATTGIVYTRDVYNCFDLIGDLGGVQQVLVVFIGIICVPYSQFAYNLKMSKHLFMARTHDKKMFLRDKKQNHSSECHLSEE